MPFPISVSISGYGHCHRAVQVGETAWEVWAECWAENSAWTFGKPTTNISVRNWYSLQYGMQRNILFFDTTGVSQDLMLRVQVAVGGGGWGGGQVYILNGNGADPDFGAEIFGWIRGRFSSEYLIATKDINSMSSGSFYYFFIPAAHINSSGYTVLLLVYSSDYEYLGAPNAGVVLLTAGSQLSLSSAGYIWVEGTKLAYIDTSQDKMTKEGTLDGAAGKIAGHIWIEGDNVRYIDASGDERYIAGTLEGATGKTPGHIWFEITKIRYIDSSGNERYFEGS